MVVKRRVAAGAAALAALAGGGAAIAATQTTPKQESDAIVDDAAARLGVTPAELSDALEEALAKRVDAAVAAGRLTAEQGADLKARIAAGDVPLVGFGPGHGHGRPGFMVELDAAASFLGLTEAGLREELEDGKTLAEIAGEHGKSVEGLVAALTAAAKERIQADDRLTEAEKEARLAGLPERITALVNGTVRHRHGPPDLDAEVDAVA